MIAAVGRTTKPDSQRLAARPRIIVALLGGFLLAALSFSQAAASIGIVLETFRPLGGGFFSWSSGQRSLAVGLVEAPDKAKSGELIETGRTGLKYAPLSARSLWLVGKGLEVKGEFGAAQKAMVRAEKITRRDGAVQLWLGDNDLRRMRVASALRHYDLIIRTEPRVAGEVVTRLAAIMTAPEGRKYLQPYIRDDNPWLPLLFTKAIGQLPRAEPVGRLLVERKKMAPALAELESTYGFLMTRLVAEGSEDVALDLYPLLPRANAAALNGVAAMSNGKPVEGYPPVIWSFADTETHRSNLVALEGGDGGIEFFGSPGTVGVAATKLIALRSNMRLQWQVRERSNNLQSAATWVATCIKGRSIGMSASSVNLLAETLPLGKDLTLQFPRDCDLVRLEMRVSGGIGRNPANLIVGKLALLEAASQE